MRLSTNPSRGVLYFIITIIVGSCGKPQTTDSWLNADVPSNTVDVGHVMSLKLDCESTLLKCPFGTTCKSAGDTFTCEPNKED